MDGTRKRHPKQGNPVTKERTWYALTNKQMLVQKLKMNNLQFTQHRKLKKKEDLSEGAMVPLRKGIKCSQEQQERQCVEQSLK